MAFLFAHGFFCDPDESARAVMPALEQPARPAYENAARPRRTALRDRQHLRVRSVQSCAPQDERRFVSFRQRKLAS
ncbi:hypothetical protein BFF94_012610 [Burkholderia catarinensis]|nr:hypothetical protein BFF94_012610 [Burkholderia catarinensis]